MNRTGLLVASGAILVALLLALVVAVRRGQPDAGRPDPAEVDGRAATATARGARPTIEADDPGASAVVAGVRDPRPVAPSGPMLGEILGEAERRVRAAARRCPNRGVAADERFMFQYTLIVRAGNASIDGPTVVDSNLSDPELGSCLLREIDAVAWPVAGEDRRQVVTDTLSSAHFRAAGE